MAKNKYDFISELLEEKKLTSSQIDRILKLASEEMKNDDINGNELLERIKKIEVKLNIEQRNFKTATPEAAHPVTPTNLPKYINPSQLHTYLLEYNQDAILKYTCHEIDSQDIVDDINARCGTNEYTLLEHNKLILAAFENLSQVHKINPKIYSLIRAYLTGSEVWSSEKITSSWKSVDLIKWSKHNPGRVPNPSLNFRRTHKYNSFELTAFNSRFSRKSISTFSDLVIYFKSLFHIKSDNSLKTSIHITSEIEEHWKNKITFEENANNFLENIELFTDVDKLLQAYRIIISMIIDTAEKRDLGIPVVKLSFKEELSDVVFSIHHINTIYQKTIFDTIKRIGETQTKLIKNQINGLCDLFIRADFGHNQYAEINLWDGNKRVAKPIESFNGVEFSLKFRR